MKNLKLGNHTVTVNYTDGSATTNLKVIENGSTPSTLDNIVKYVAIGAISLAAIVGIIILLKKKKD